MIGHAFSSNFSIYPLTSEAEPMSFTFSKFHVSSISVSAVNSLAQVKLALYPGPQSNFFVFREMTLTFALRCGVGASLGS
jgi:hypothetical protein